MANHDFVIGIPTMNRADLLVPTLEKYVKDFPNTKIVVIDNGFQEIPRNSENVVIIRPKVNMGVACSWNIICDIGFMFTENVLLVNDDIYLGYGEAQVKKAIQRNKVGLAQSEHLWSVVLINKALFQKVGYFDTLFYPAYCEDSDYMYRMKVMGMRHKILPELNPKVVRHGMTMEKAQDYVQESLKVNRIRYAEKWGGLPLLETYTEPYNGKKTVSEYK